MQSLVSTVVLVLLSISGFSQSIFRQWITIDEDTGEQKSVVEIYEKNNMLYGKIVKIFPGPGDDPDPLCTECEDDRKNERIIGLEIIRDMKKDEIRWEKGTILDPRNGNVYDCELWIEDGKLKVRGYFSFFYRTQTWIPYNMEN